MLFSDFIDKEREWAPSHKIIINTGEPKEMNQSKLLDHNLFFLNIALPPTSQSSPSVPAQASPRTRFPASTDPAASSSRFSPLA